MQFMMQINNDYNGLFLSNYLTYGNGAFGIYFAGNFGKFNVALMGGKL